MSIERDQSAWPPENLADYYKSDSFLRHLKSLQRRLERAYANVDAESIVYDCAADILVKEIGQHCIYDTFMTKFENEKNFLSYLYESCCRKVIDNARSFQRKFRQLLEEDNVEDTGLGPEETAIELEEMSRNAELVRELEKTVINKQPKIDRLILKYRIEGRTFQEIAELLDIGVSTVHRKHKAIIKKLAIQLEGRSEGEKVRPTR